MVWATGSDPDPVQDFESVDDLYAGEVDLYNDLETGTSVESDVTLSDIYDQQLVTNRLFGILIAMMIIFMIFGLFRFIVKLVSDNITNQF